MNMEAAFAAARNALGSQEVELYRWGDPDINLWTFVRMDVKTATLEEPTKRRFYMVSPETGRGILIPMYPDAQSQYQEGTFSVLAGLQSQTYALEITEVKKWTRSLKLLELMNLDPARLQGLQLPADNKLNWPQLGKKTLAPILESQGQLQLINVDLNLHLRELCAAEYFKCFKYKLFEYSDGKIRGPVHLSEPHKQDFFDEFEDAPEDFWLDVDDLLAS